MIVKPKTYVMIRRNGHSDVFVRSMRPLNPRFDLACHSPTGFEWGYGGSGPAQLALAILADALGDDRRALDLYQEFKWEAIASHSRDANWEITQEQVQEIARHLEAQRTRP